MPLLAPLDAPLAGHLSVPLLNTSQTVSILVTCFAVECDWSHIIIHRNKNGRFYTSPFKFASDQNHGISACYDVIFILHCERYIFCNYTYVQEGTFAPPCPPWERARGALPPLPPLFRHRCLLYASMFCVWHPVGIQLNDTDTARKKWLVFLIYPADKILSGTFVDDKKIIGW